MSPSKRRVKRRHGRPAADQAHPMQITGRPSGGGGPALPDWKWKTFPVYFAFSLGLFLGIYAGALGVWAGGEGNNTVFLVVSVSAAIFLGFGMSRLFVRGLVGRLIRRWTGSAAGN